MLEEIEELWGVSPTNPHCVSEPERIAKLGYKALQISSEESIESIQEKFDKHIEEIIKVQNDEDKKDFEKVVRINRVLEIVYYSKQVCVGIKRIGKLFDLNQDFRGNTDTTLFRFKAIDMNENTKYQNFILFILAKFYENNYCRYNGEVYKLIITSEGFNTFAWKRIGTIQETIYKSICKEVNYEQFINVTHKSDAVRSATEFLTNCVDSQFRALKKDRHIFSFRNGVYFANTDTFESYCDLRSDDFVSAKYFDKDFNYIDSWQDVNTPYFDSIFKHQEVSEEVMQWIYVMTGRLIYEIDELDGWQVIFFIQGQAGTGKSTYANSVCKQLYDEEDVGIMSNNIQRQFGLSDLIDKLLYVAPEIKRDFNIEQGEFQSIISGDKVTINVKFKSSRFENWVIPGVMAGNESPDFIDNAGSVQRRLVTLRFNKKVHNGDLLLGKKIQEEMPNLILKCNKAYREIASVFGRDNIWQVLPTYFKTTKEELAKATNPLIHFLLSENVILNKDVFVPEKLFMEAFNQHCRSNNYSKYRYNPDFYMGPFADNNIKVLHKVSKTYNGSKKTGTYYQGVDLVFGEETNEFIDL